MPRPLVVCCFTGGDPSWRWLADRPEFAGYDWEFIDTYDGTQSRASSRCREAVKLAKARGASGIVTHGSLAAKWCALWMMAMRVKIPLLAWAYHFDIPPTGPRKWLYRFAGRRIDRAVVFSSTEVELYTREFGIRPGRLQMTYWGVRPDEGRQAADASAANLPDGPYVSAIGGSARDYATLFKAARQFPDLRLIAVMRPQNLEGLEVPPNVEVRCNIPYPQALAILQHSAFTIIPMIRTARSGHGMLVLAWHMGVAVIISGVEGVKDYVREGQNALAPAPSDPAALAAAARRLWEDPAMRQELAEGGRRFAVEHCTEDATADFAASLFGELGI